MFDMQAIHCISCVNINTQVLRGTSPGLRLAISNFATEGLFPQIRTHFQMVIASETHLSKRSSLEPLYESCRKYYQMLSRCRGIEGV